MQDLADVSEIYPPYTDLSGEFPVGSAFFTKDESLDIDGIYFITDLGSFYQVPSEGGFSVLGVIAC
jgi:hypothetical protein